MNGGDVRKSREALGWKRPQLAAATGLSIAQIAGIEAGRSIRPDEESSLRRVLLEQLGGILTSNGTVRDPNRAPVRPESPSTGPDGPSSTDPSSDPLWDSGTTVLEEWCGLVKGSAVKLDGDKHERATYEFIHHYTSPAQTYVLIKTKNGATRPVRPEKVLRLNPRKTPKWIPAESV